MTKQGVPRMLLLEAELCKCRSKRKLLGLLLTDMIVLLEADGSKYRLYRQVARSLARDWIGSPIDLCRDSR